MCGIMGIINKKGNAIKKVIEGLEKLEYRGYDSCGIAYLTANKIETIKTKGRGKDLKELIDTDTKSDIAIGHTRWATHGVASTINAHPHTVGDITIVHNGIIENYLELKDILSSKGYSFKSTTDTEVACALIDFYYQENKDINNAITSFMAKVKGSYAIVLLCKDIKDKIFVIKKDSPLVIGVNTDTIFIASDIPTILSECSDYYLLNDLEWASINSDKITFYSNKGKELIKEKQTFKDGNFTYSKDKYDHFMLKEIMEQKDTLSNLINYYLKDNKYLDLIDISKYKRIDIVACGSAYHAGLVGKYLFEEKANVETEVYLASEYRYKKNFLDENSLVIFISQSGETADTLACLKKIKETKAHSLGIINVENSSISLLVDEVIYTKSGSEIAVATTKAYTSQIAILLLLTLASLVKHNKSYEIDEIINELKNIKDDVIKVLDNKDKYKSIAKKIVDSKKIFFLGRSLDYAIMREGDLKLKEITYLSSECYAAGELKHGPISLIDKDTLVIAGNTNKLLYEKTESNLSEVVARGANIILVTNKGEDDSNTIVIPERSNFITPILEVIPLQLISYYTGVFLERDIDKPRNLAKSVTVE